MAIIERQGSRAQFQIIDNGLRNPTDIVTAINQAKNPFALADLYKEYRRQSYQGFTEPAQADPAFYDTLTQLLEIPRDKLFNNKDVSVTPFTTLVWDYAWKAYVPDSPYRTFKAATYKTFLDFMRNDPNFSYLVTKTLQYSQVDGMATHPPLLDIIYKHYSLPLDTEECDESQAVRATEQALGNAMLKPEVMRDYSFTPLVSGTSVTYKTTFANRYNREYEYLAQQQLLPSVKLLVDYGSGDTANSSQSLLSTWKKSGLELPELCLGIDPFAEEDTLATTVEDTIPLKVIKGSVMPSYNMRKIDETIQAYKNEFGVISMNVITPHIAEISNTIAYLLFHKPKFMVIYGGFFDFAPGSAFNDGEIHVFTRNQKADNADPSEFPGYTMTVIKNLE